MNLRLFHSEAATLSKRLRLLPQETDFRNNYRVKEPIISLNFIIRAANKPGGSVLPL